MERSNLINHTYKDFKKIVINKIPLIDVRAPIEYAKGSFLNSINLPLMNDEERHLVGICYKEKGQEEAVKLGYELVAGEKRSSRTEKWISYLNENPNSMIYCFRGGQRSIISQEWINEISGKKVLRLFGGYKAFRNYLLEELAPEKQKAIPVLLGGYTGSGKTILLNKLENSIDLEGIANHRGSSFGNKITEQPSQITFENNLSTALISHRENYKYMILEDESRNVGRCFIPKGLFEFFRIGKLVIVDVPLEKRIEITFDEYVFQSQDEYIEFYGIEQGFLEWSAYIVRSIKKLEKRIGSKGQEKIMTLFNEAFKEQMRTNRLDLHKNWIEVLLREYYDPMYFYQMKKRDGRVAFQGSTQEVLEYLKTLVY